MVRLPNSVNTCFLVAIFASIILHIALIVFKQPFAEHAINARNDLALFGLMIFRLGEDKILLVLCENAVVRKPLPLSYSSG